MPDYRYKLQSRKKYTCPQCRGVKKFSRYIDTTTGAELADDVGICDRLNRCGYHKPPREHFKETCPQPEPKPFIPPHRPPLRKSTTSKCHPKPAEGQQLNQSTYQPVNITNISIITFHATLRAYKHNHLVTYLNRLLGTAATDRLIEQYYIGTSAHWPGATVFWQMDAEGAVRTGKIMLYDPATGRRSRDARHAPTWVHSVLRLPGFALQQCLFGAHLAAAEPHKTIALVESEKTALIAAALMPQYVWMACGGMGNLTEHMCHPLQGRNIILFPDLQGYDAWRQKAAALRHIATFQVSDLLERHAPAAHRQEGYDIADYLVHTPHAARTALLHTLAAGFTAACTLLTTGMQTRAEHLAYQSQLMRQLKDAGIPLRDFVRLTMEM